MTSIASSYFYKRIAYNCIKLLSFGICDARFAVASRSDSQSNHFNFYLNNCTFFLSYTIFVHSTKTNAVLCYTCKYFLLFFPDRFFEGEAFYFCVDKLSIFWFESVCMCSKHFEDQKVISKFNNLKRNKHNFKDCMIYNTKTISIKLYFNKSYFHKNTF